MGVPFGHKTYKYLGSGWTPWLGPPDGQDDSYFVPDVWLIYLWEEDYADLPPDPSCQMRRTLLSSSADEDPPTSITTDGNAKC